jgi:hypothetical protein
VESALLPEGALVEAFGGGATIAALAAMGAVLVSDAAGVALVAVDAVLEGGAAVAVVGVSGANAAGDDAAFVDAVDDRLDIDAVGAALPSVAPVFEDEPAAKGRGE